jgi:hypothetical protein
MVEFGFLGVGGRTGQRRGRDGAMGARHHGLFHGERSGFQVFAFVRVLSWQGPIPPTLLDHVGEFVGQEFLATRAVQRRIPRKVDLPITREGFRIDRAGHLSRVRTFVNRHMRRRFTHRTAQRLLDGLGHRNTARTRNLRCGRTRESRES